MRIAADPRRHHNSRFFYYLPILIILLAVPLLSASSAAQAAKAAGPRSALELQVDKWVTALSVREPFTAWKDAATEIHALGPGTHGWLALLKAGGQPVGYLIVQAAPDGSYRLEEYGVGPHVLFSSATLARTLLENGLIGSEDDDYTAVRHYVQPFAAVWEVNVGEETYWVDAKTGEILPIDRTGWDKHSASKNSAHDRLPAARVSTIASLSLIDTFDPYDRLPWVTGEKPLAIHNGAKVQHRIAGGLHLRYVTEPYGEAALYALPVVGFQSWSNGRLDLALDMEGYRFIPIGTLQRYGRFYK